MVKWIFLGLWLVCLVIFSIGQLMAPPEYHLIPNNPWGSLFGITVVLGIIFFIITIILFATNSFKGNKTHEVGEGKKSKYNLSFSRIISRLFITFLVGIIFGIAMMPFLTVADGLLYEQRAAIGGQNMTKMVVLWAIFTLIVALYAFWKKHLRMVAVLLIICWVISLGLLMAINMYSANNFQCSRSTPYAIPSEFNRALDLISQRTGVDSTGSNTIWQTIFNFRNCLNIQYSDLNDNEVEAYFEYPQELSQKSLQQLNITVNPSYKNFDDLTLATLLAHELVHAGQYINEVINKDKLDCYVQEARAFSAQHAFVLSLNQEEQRSIYTRLRDNAEQNPAIAVFLLTGERGNESALACSELQKKNNLSVEQVNKCSWEGLENKLLLDIKEDPYYQKQCDE